MEHRNPWLSIWIHPRATIAQIVAGNPNRSLWWLAGIYGFCSLMNLFQSMMLGTALSPIAIFILAIILAPFWGWLLFSIWSLFIAWTGKWLKGGGHFTTVRAAYAWSCVPLIVNIPLWLLLAVIFGQQLFLNFPNAHLFPHSQMMLLFAISGIKVVLAIWSLVIYLNALAEVQKFSVLRAIFNVLMAGILFGVAAYLLWMLLVYALGGFAMSPLTLWNIL